MIFGGCLVSCILLVWFVCLLCCGHHKGKKVHMWTPHTENPTCGLHIRKSTPHVVSVCDHIRTVYDHRAKSHVDSTYELHIRTPHTEIIYGKPHVVFRIWFDVCIWFQRKPHVDSTYGKSHTVNHIRYIFQIICGLHMWTHDIVWGKPHVDSTCGLHMWTPHVNTVKLMQKTTCGLHMWTPHVSILCKYYTWVIYVNITREHLVWFCTV